MAFLNDQLLFVLRVVLDVILNVGHQAKSLHVRSEVESLTRRRLVVFARSRGITDQLGAIACRSRRRRAPLRGTSELELLAAGRGCPSAILRHEGTWLQLLIGALFVHE